MTTLTVEYPKDLKQYVGRELGPSDWMTVDQAMIDKFADATGDHQWIHVDVERAKREMPGGKTIAHGYHALARTAHGGNAGGGHQAEPRSQLRLEQGTLHQRRARRLAD